MGYQGDIAMTGIDSHCVERCILGVYTGGMVIKTCGPQGLIKVFITIVRVVSIIFFCKNLLFILWYLRLVYINVNVFCNNTF